MGKEADVPHRLVESLSSGRCPLCAMLRHDEFDSLCEWVGESAPYSGPGKLDQKPGLN